MSRFRTAGPAYAAVAAGAFERAGAEVVRGGRSDLARRFPDAPAARVRRVVQQLRSEGRMLRVGAGRGAQWERVTKG